MLVPPARNPPGDMGVERLSPDLQILEFTRTGITRLAEDEDPLFRMPTEGFHRVPAHIGIHRDRIRAVNFKSLAGIFFRGGADIIAFRIEDEEMPGVGLPDVSAEAPGFGGTVFPCKIGDLGFEGGTVGRSGIDNSPAKSPERFSFSLQNFGQPVKGRIEANAKERIRGGPRLFELVRKTEHVGEGKELSDEGKGAGIEKSRRFRSFPKMEKSNLLLSGMAGAGKSTVGRILARRLGMAFLDTDDWIEERTGRKLPRIREEEGWQGFRDLEKQCCLDLQPARTVIASGGSVIYHPDVMNHFRKTALNIWLDVPLNVILSRLTPKNIGSLARKPDQSFEELFEERFSLYEAAADLRIPTGEDSAEEISERILTLISPDRDA